MHTRGHIREFFEELVEEGYFGAGEDSFEFLDAVAGISDDADRKILTVGGLLGKLWRSTDIMPGHLRGRLQEERGWDEEAYTYAQAAQRLHAELRD